MKTSLTLAVALTLAAAGQAASLGDDFNDNKVDPAKWGPDEKYGKGTLTETAGRLQYTVTSTPTDDDDLIRHWKPGSAPYDADWEMQIDLYNGTEPAETGQINSFGIKVRNARDENDGVYVEMFASGFTGFPFNKGYDTEFETDDSTVFYTGSPDSVLANAGAVRMAFDASNKVITVFYDLDPLDGYQWIPFGSFGVAGAGGTDANSDWGMADDDQFRVYVYGFSSNMRVPAGAMWGDNFLTTGFVEPASLHDLAVTRITAPRTVLLTDRRPAATRRVSVTIQNRGEHSEVISILTGLVTLALEALSTNGCPAPIATLHAGSPQKRLPYTLRPKRKMNVYFDVPFDCAADALKGAGHADFRYLARVHHEAINGRPDAHPECDVCPRPPLPDGRDPHPDGRVRDSGCGSRVSRGVYGGDVLTDVVRRP